MSSVLRLLTHSFRGDAVLLHVHMRDCSVHASVKFNYYVHVVELDSWQNI